ncbi:MAG: hypothetical protein FWC11_06290, partial [Firmicutes bacterium]|nr:hypothetical protein [Bacillota bacterium]
MNKNKHWKLNEASKNEQNESVIEEVGQTELSTLEPRQEVEQFETVEAGNIFGASTDCLHNEESTSENKPTSIVSKTEEPKEEEELVARDQLADSWDGKKAKNFWGSMIKLIRFFRPHY